MGMWQVVKKDLTVLGRDRRALAVLLVMPLVFIAILGLSTGKLLGWRNENETLRVALADESGTEASRALVEALEGRAGIDVARVASRDTATGLVEEGERTAAVVLGPEYEERVAALSLADAIEPERGKLAGGIASLGIEVHAKPSQTMARALVEQVVFGAAIRTILPRIARRDPVARVYLARVRPAEPAAATEPAAGRPATNPMASYGSEVYQVVVPGYTVMFSFFLINIMGRSFLSEQDLGTLRRLRLAPIGPSALLAGKTVPFLIISVLQGGLLFLFGRLLFGMSWGARPAMLLLVIASTSLAATSLGLLVATLVRSDAQVSAYANLLVITMAGISGCFMPRDWLPGAMRRASLATPHAWALMAYDQLLTRARPDVPRVLECCLMLAAFALGFFLLGAWRFRHAES